MNYRLQVLTPLLVGDGRSLSPIDYMVWRDQVNVLNQERIFKLLSRGPRLDGYLNQLRRAEKLDFATWGGFAQNYAGRRIGFEHHSLTKHWESTRAEYCHIPVFASVAAGPYVPGSALRGALRTALIASRVNAGLLSTIDQAQDPRVARRPGDLTERHADMMRALPVSDSCVAARDRFKVYMVRVSSLTGVGPKYTQTWKPNPVFAEMAEPGTEFRGAISERAFFQDAVSMESLRWKEKPSVSALFEAANQYAGLALASHESYAATAGLADLGRTVAALRSRLAEVKENGKGCLLALGWGTGIYGKTAWPKLDDETYRRILSRHAVYARAIRTGLPFPKTRRVVFMGDKPVSLPGWVLVEGE